MPTKAQTQTAPRPPRAAITRAPLGAWSARAPAMAESPVPDWPRRNRTPDPLERGRANPAGRGSESSDL